MLSLCMTEVWLLLRGSYLGGGSMWFKCIAFYGENLTSAHIFLCVTLPRNSHAFCGAKRAFSAAICCIFVQPSLSKIQPVGNHPFLNAQSVPIFWWVDHCIRNFVSHGQIRGLRAMNEGRVGSIWVSVSFLKPSFVNTAGIAWPN